jgi:hypothetical protein
MRAKFINEKFQEESDPIRDMGIGGIKIIDLYDDFFDKMNDIYPEGLTQIEEMEIKYKWQKY